MYQPGERSQRPPRDQDRSDAPSRAPAFNHERAGNLQCNIADKENSRAQSEYSIVKPERPGHPNRRVGNASAVKIIGDVENKKKRKQTQGNLTASMIRK